MSRPKEIIVCDKCGVELPYWLMKESVAKIHLWGIGVLKSGAFQRIDLCEECYDKFVAFLESGSEE